MSCGDTGAVVAIIPARLASTRFPRKVLAPLDGKPLVMHAYQRASAAKCVSETIIATDDIEALEALRPYHARVVMTRPDHPSGTDRIAEVAQSLNASIIVNVQADEPLLEPDAIEAAVAALREHPESPMATLCRQIQELGQISDPNIVKVVRDARNRALYFSRAPIPHVRDHDDLKSAVWMQHIGLYAYRREFLIRFASLPQTPLERLEKLEQLRALEHGFSIMVVETDCECIGVDTRDDLERVQLFLHSHKR